MCSQHREFTWDNVIDLLLVMTMQNEDQSETIKKSDSEMFGTISQLSQIKKDQESQWGGFVEKPFFIKHKAHGNKTGGQTTPKEVFAVPQEEVKSSFSYQVKNQINNAAFSENNSFRKQKSSDGGKLSDIDDSSDDEPS